MIEGRGHRAWRSDLLWSIGLGVAYYVAAQLSLNLGWVGQNIPPPEGSSCRRVFTLAGIGESVPLEPDTDAALARILSGTSDTSS